MSLANKQIKIFFLEDNPDDVELEVYELKKAGFDISFDIARNRKEFLEKAPDFASDIILADYSLPDITGIEAISLCRQMKIDTPVILITGEGNELIAVDSLRLGAIDYIIKRNIAGLPARVSRALEIWNDRKARERAEAEEKRLQQILFESQKMEAIGRLAGGVAHDFNNILTGIIGFSELCRFDTPRGSDIHNNLQSILDLSQRGADLVKQLLIYSRKMPMEFKKIDLNSFIVETMQFLKRMVEETIEIKLELQKDIPKIKCDTGKFIQVLMNLTLNARDAMQGKGILTIKTGQGFPEDEFSPARPENHVNEYICLSISDNGSGIDKGDIKKIFDPFFTTKRIGKGIGLGLAIVYSVVKAHDGLIKVLSEKGIGTTFNIYLPLFKSEKYDKEIIFSERMIDNDALKIRGEETVLLAEDEDVLRELGASILRSFGYNVVVARDGEEALDIYRKESKKINVVISDMVMPKKDGIDLFKDLRSINSGVKYILVTGYSLSDQDETILKKMDAILTKPYTPLRLVGMMRDVLDR